MEEGGAGERGRRGRERGGESDVSAENKVRGCKRKKGVWLLQVIRID